MKKKQKASFDAAAYISSILYEDKPVDLDSLAKKRAPAYFKSLVKNNPAHAIARYLASFGRYKGRTKIASIPDEFILEYLAECFSSYWQGDCKTLDEAFHLNSKGRGSKTPKEKYTDRLRDFREKAVYQGFLETFQKEKTSSARGDELPSELAVKATADYFGINEESLRKRLRRKSAG